jgi:hypothetical protein
MGREDPQLWLAGGHEVVEARAAGDRYVLWEDGGAQRFTAVQPA